MPRRAPALAETHRLTPMAARTLLQQAVPTTFGLKAAGWLVAVTRALRRLRELRERLPAQLGGAAGTLAVLGADGPAGGGFLRGRARAREAGASLACGSRASSPISGRRSRVRQAPARRSARHRSARADRGGRGAGAAGQGGSSTMPHKRNPGRIGDRGCVLHGAFRRPPGFSPGSRAEHERALGAWQAEWGALSDALAYAGGAAAAIRGGRSTGSRSMRAGCAQTWARGCDERAPRVPSCEDRTGLAEAKARSPPARSEPRRRVGGSSRRDRRSALPRRSSTRSSTRRRISARPAVFVDDALSVLRSDVADERSRSWHGGSP